MTDGNPLSIDERLIRELSGPAKVAALLKAQGYSYQALAREHGFWPAQVKMCVYGTRAYPAVRTVLARVLALPREEIDRLLAAPGITAESDDPSERSPAAV